jgi:hypothetical protein
MTESLTWEGVEMSDNKGHRKLWEVMDMFTILTVAVISQVFVHAGKNLPSCTL